MSEPTRFGDWLTLDAPPGGRTLMIMEKLRRGVKVMMIRDLTGGNGGRRRLGRARNEEESQK